MNTGECTTLPGTGAEELGEAAPVLRGAGAARAGPDREVQGGLVIAAVSPTSHVSLPRFLLLTGGEPCTCASSCTGKDCKFASSEKSWGPSLGT